AGRGRDETRAGSSRGVCALLGGVRIRGERDPRRTREAAAHRRATGFSFAGGETVGCANRTAAALGDHAKGRSPLGRGHPPHHPRGTGAAVLGFGKGRHRWPVRSLNGACTRCSHIHTTGLVAGFLISPFI